MPHRPAMRLCNAAPAIGSCLALAAAAAFAAPAPAPAPDDPVVRQVMAWTHAPRAAIVATRSDIVVAILKHAAVPPATPNDAAGAIGVELEGEVVDAATAQRLGYRSLHAAADVDCAERRDRVLKLEVYDAHGLKGAHHPLQPPGTWALPTTGAYMHAVILAVCGAGANRREEESRLAQAVLARPRPGALALAAPVPPPPASPENPVPAGPEQPPPTPKPKPAAPPTPAAPAPPPLAPAPAAPAGPPPTPEPNPTAPIETPPPSLAPVPPSEPIQPEPQATSAQSQPGPAPAPPKPRPGARTLTAQLGALDSEAAARERIAALKLPADLTGAVGKIQLHGKTFYRALITGFPDYGAASAFCERMHASQRDCWVH